MVDIIKEENTNGIRLAWNVFPANKVDMQRYVVPLGFHYSPNKPVEGLQLLEYDPIVCKSCKSVITLTTISILDLNLGSVRFAMKSTYFLLTMPNIFLNQIFQLS